MTPPLLVKLECKQCGEILWVIGSDYPDEDGKAVSYSERGYSCNGCGDSKASFNVLEQSPPGFLMQLGFMLPEEEAYWMEILRANFPDHPRLTSKKNLNYDLPPSPFVSWELDINSPIVINEGTDKPPPEPPDFREPVADLEIIPLENRRPTLYLARIDEESLLDEADFYIGVNGDADPTKIISTTSRLIKIVWIEVMDQAIGSALPGLQVHYAPPPKEFVTRSLPEEIIQQTGFGSFFLDTLTGFQFFRLEKDGPYWKGIRESKNIAIRIPDEFSNLRLRFYADRSHWLRADQRDQNRSAY
ncbi:MAG: type VI secretion system baseplate subunit TssK [Pyrinomonadaceae bacterium]